MVYVHVLQPNGWPAQKGSANGMAAGAALW